MGDTARTVGDRRDVTFTATAAYPYVERDRATMGLRAALRHQPAIAGAEPDWSTLTVDGPTEVRGAHGRSWFQWQASVRT
jgi:hypothetical protein